MVTIHIPRSVYEDMRQHLLPRRSRDEQAGFVYARANPTAETSLTFDYLRWEALRRDDFDYQSPLHLELRDETKARVIKTAHDLQCSLIEFHSHRGPWPAQFSGSDFAGFEEFVPHVLWRLKGKPYAAVVLTATGIDGLAWTPGSAFPVYALNLGDVEIQATGASFKTISEGEAWNG